MRVFRLSSVGYDTNKDWFFQGPDNMTEAAFKAICGGLLPEAAQTALAASKEINRVVMWKDIMLALEQALLVHGLEVYEMPTMEFYEQWVLDYRCRYSDMIGEVMEDINLHNSELTKNNWRSATDS